MTLRRMLWSGQHFVFRIARHWDAFGGLAAIYEVNNIKGAKRLPPGADVHLLRTHDVVEQARSVFSSVDDWHSWSRSLCDHYGDAFVLRRPRPDNPFWYGIGRGDDQKVKFHASEQRGFVGAKDWWST
jgi:hypothetical protein